MQPGEPVNRGEGPAIGGRGLQRGEGPLNRGRVQAHPPAREASPLRASRSHRLTPRQIGRRAVARRGWGRDQWRCLEALWERESGWNPRADNPHSSAYGIPQFLNSTWASVGGRRTSNPELQIRYGLRYVVRRYRTPCGAWRFWLEHRWY